MIRIARFLACILVCICLSRTAFGWGGTGHQVIAQIAYDHLDPAVKAKCNALVALPPECGTVTYTFVGDSTWTDQRCESGTSPEHYIDIPLCTSGFAGNGNCLDGSSTNGLNPPFTNVVWALNQNIAILLNSSATQSNKATALRYVLHFVGDIQQPCHASTGVSAAHPTGDGGGNSFSLKGTYSELHALWDAGAGCLTNVNAVVAVVESNYTYNVSIGTIPDPMTWAQDSWNVARTNAYANGITENGTPSTSYLNAAQAATKWRMAVGGQTLGNLLNTIFLTNAASFTASPTNGAAPLTVSFTDTSTGSITNRFWNFGDGTTTNFPASTNPTHNYATGTYTVTLIVSGYPGSSTNTRSSLITATSSCTPPTASVSGSQTICQGGTATIHASLTGSGSWNVTWLDGAGGTNYIQNGVAATPATRIVSPSSTTTYTVTAVSDSTGCSGGTSSGSATVTVDVPTTPTASNNGPICSGGTLTLSTPSVAGTTYSWTGPNGFTSAQQNPSIAGATTAASGIYSVTITDGNGCTSAPGSTTATVNPIPATPTASNNGPICSGGTLTLSTPAVAGATYSWTGPNGFTSAQQNPSIPSATTDASGTYSVTVTSSSGCPSPAGSTIATVNPIPAAPTAGNNGPILTGTTLNLTASTLSGGTYNWTGPNGFTSTDQNPSIPNATSAVAGTYSVTVTDSNGCTSAAGSTTAVVASPQITAITTQGSDILITWATIGGTTNVVQATPGNPDYTNFVDISDLLFIAGSGNSSTNYTDPGAVTNSPAKFYRVRLVP
jgi:PKD repeat protein